MICSIILHTIDMGLTAVLCGQFDHMHRYNMNVECSMTGYVFIVGS